ncbi:MAG: NADPH-dependent glutamate synthase [Candidatus Izimaplasma sp.]|nr:NADPH-dependent glutamate synthase [Candidatus Izimaplasma bacterium]
MIKNKIKMNEQSPKERTTNFKEVALGYTKQQAIEEAKRCLQCDSPKCVSACPVEIDIPKFIQQLTNNQFKAAYNTIEQDNILPSICGRVCPQEKQCEGACVLNAKFDSVSIGALEHFIGDFALKENYSPSHKITPVHHKIAIVGSGPAGLSNATTLTKLGYDVTIYEALHRFGGVLNYGIPEFRLPNDIINQEINKVKALNVKFEKNVVIGKSITIDQLFTDHDYKAVFIGSGAGLPRRLNIKGENYGGVLYANEFLTRVNLMDAANFPTTKTPIKTGDDVAVVGGGNVAMDAARTAKRLGAKNIFIIYRRDETSLPARVEEIKHAKEEGIEFRLTLNPVAFNGENYRVSTVVCQKMRLGEKDASGRRRPLPTDTYKTFKIDTCIIAIGQRPNPILSRANDQLKTDEYGRVVVNNHETSIPNVFAGGDIVSGAATVIHAMGAGKKAAYAMDQKIKSS